MAKFFIVYAVEFLCGLLLFTQVMIPLFVPKLKFFWLFKGKDKTTPSTLGELSQRASSNREERDRLKEEASSIKDALSDIEDKTA